jgi:hypothetical protein
MHLEIYDICALPPDDETKVLCTLVNYEPSSLHSLVHSVYTSAVCTCNRAQNRTPLHQYVDHAGL